MVKDSARILTGYTVNAWENWKPYYDTVDPLRRARSTVLDFTAPERQGGRPGT